VPNYSYACTECDNRFDVAQSFTDDALTTCPECSGRLRKLFNSVGVVFKGSGFYRTDSRESGKGAASGSAENSSGSEPSGSDKSSAPDKSSNSEKPQGPAKSSAADKPAGSANFSGSGASKSGRSASAASSPG